MQIGKTKYRNAQIPVDLKLSFKIYVKNVQVPKSNTKKSMKLLCKLSVDNTLQATMLIGC